MSVELDERRRHVLAAVAGGAAFLASGAALVVHVVTGAPLPLVLAMLVAGGALAVARLVWADPVTRRRWLVRLRVGVVTGAFATVVYDVSRWALVQVGGMHISPFKALPFFGEALLLGTPAASGAAHVAGIAFHIVNGVAFGIAYTVWFGRRGVVWGIGFALGLEALMLTIYPGWLDIRAIGEFTQLSVFGHVAYGIALGWTARHLLDRSRSTT
jgi:hypothetical protein